MGDGEVVVKNTRARAICGRVGETPWGCEDLPAEAGSALRYAGPARCARSGKRPSFVRMT
jgi:hypothetical protein